MNSSFHGSRLKGAYTLLRIFQLFPKSPITPYKHQVQKTVTPMKNIANVMTSKKIALQNINQMDFVMRQYVVHFIGFYKLELSFSS